MLKDFRVGVVIPCYRVEAAIADVIARVPEFVDAIIAVDDACPDRTAQRLAEIESDRLVILTHYTSRAKGALELGLHVGEQQQHALLLGELAQLQKSETGRRVQTQNEPKVQQQIAYSGARIDLSSDPFIQAAGGSEEEEALEQELARVRGLRDLENPKPGSDKA